MNPLEKLLQDDLNHLVDRIAARAGEGAAAGLTPDLKTRIERCEDRVTALRAALLDGYVEWARTLEECEGLWVVAGLRTDAAETPARVTRKAA